MLKRQTLTGQVVEYIANLIKSGEKGPGDRLPTEKELTELLGISRTCVREAMKSLESLRLIRLRPKVGAVVLAPSPTGLLNAEAFARGDDDRSVQELLEFRSILETGVAALAAERATEADIRSMYHAIERFKSEVETGNISCHTDMSFHSAVAAASKNAMAVMVWELIAPHLAGHLEVVNSSDCSTYAAMETVREHLKILEAIKERNPRKARALMARHLENAKVICRLASSQLRTTTARIIAPAEKR
jgi:GntR family transcriptional repressor for pyruvate dehydrogenase complex